MSFHPGREGAGKAGELRAAAALKEAARNGSILLIPSELPLGSAGPLVGMDTPVSEASRVLPLVSEAPSGRVSSAMDLPRALPFPSAGATQGDFLKEMFSGRNAWDAARVVP